MNIVWFSWKDISHPQAGGAEVVSDAIRQRLVRDGHNVRLITAAYGGSADREVSSGVEVFRSGNRYTVYTKAKRVYRQFCENWEDLVVDEMNTIPFIAARYTKQDSYKLLLAYQLARKVWFYQMQFPLSWIGYILEPLYLRFTARYYPNCATESESSRRDMKRYGFRNIKLFRIGMKLQPLRSLPNKSNRTTLISLGSVRPMKRTLDIVQAFEVARDNNPKLSLQIAGDMSSAYARKLQSYVDSSRHGNAITILGRISEEERLRRLRQAGIILVSSIKEGWGLITTEANSQGTPAIVYDVDGLRDSVRNGETGVVTESTPTAMAHAVLELLSHHQTYADIRSVAWKWSKQFTFDNSYQDFLTIITSLERPDGL